ncbi:hypothetical protein HJC23_013759, partial [Cyclotella cryptica]
DLLEQIHSMQKQESTAYKVSQDYFRDVVGRCMLNSLMISPLERKVMLSWAYDIVDLCNIERHVAVTAITYLDRFIADNFNRCEKTSSPAVLCFIGCLNIPLKNCAGMKVESEFVSNVLCRGLYEEEEILNMEMEVLQGLSWRLNRPTAIDFLPPNQYDFKIKTLIRTAEVQVERAMLDYSLGLQEPSSVAYSPILIALDSIGQKYCGKEDFHSINKFLWMQSIAMTAGLNMDGVSIHIVHNRMVEACSDFTTCHKSGTSRGLSPRTRISNSLCLL